MAYVLIGALGVATGTCFFGVGTGNGALGVGIGTGAWGTGAKGKSAASRPRLPQHAAPTLRPIK
jgi:hypothetical protein